MTDTNEDIVRVGGPRHYEGPVEAIVAWKCPSCATEQTTPISDGCPTCGAGSAKARHVGVPPRADALPTPALPLGERANAAGDPFEQWFETQGVIVAPQIKTLLEQAWVAAVAWYQRERLRTIPTSGAEPLGGVLMDLDQVAVPRALLKHILVQLEGTIDLPDEQQSPELIDLITQLKELLAP